MVVVGILLILVGAAAIVAAVGTSEGSGVQLLGVDLSPTALFLVGVAAGVAILWGWGLTKWGTKRTLRQRRESKKLSELSEKLERREAEEREEQREDPDRPV